LAVAQTVACGGHCEPEERLGQYRSPATPDLEVYLVDESGAADSSSHRAVAPPEVMGQDRREVGLLLSHRLMAEHDAALEEYLGQIP
jgi:hypothetical protein